MIAFSKPSCRARIKSGLFFRPKGIESLGFSYPVSRVEFIESTGHRFRGEAYGQYGLSNFFCLTLCPFPRRDPILHFRCYEENHDQPILELRVPNPGFEPFFVEWSPEELPITKSQGPLTVTLKRGPQDSFVNYLQAEDIEISSADKSWTEIRPQWNAWMSDATGNRSRNLSGLSPFEPAWKLTLKIHRDPSASFTEDEVWRTELFPVPADLSVTKLDLRHVAAGIELRAPFVSSAGSVEEIGGALSVTPSTDSYLGGASVRRGRDQFAAFGCIDSSRPFIYVIHAALDEATELILTVRDQTGRKISRENSTHFESNGVHTRILQFIPTEETKEVRLEAIVNRGLTFEFFVKPHKPDKVAQ